MRQDQVFAVLGGLPGLKCFEELEGVLDDILSGIADPEGERVGPVFPVYEPVDLGFLGLCEQYFATVREGITELSVFGGELLVLLLKEEGIHRVLVFLEGGLVFALPAAEADLADQGSGVDGVQARG